MKRIIRLLFILLLFPVMVYAEGLPVENFTTNVTSAVLQNNVRMAYRSKSMTSPFINSFAVPQNVRTSDGITPLYILSKNLDTPTTDNVIPVGEDNPVEIQDAGINYILTYGYNIENPDGSIFASGEYGNVTDNSIKQYDTQIALWIYIYQNKNKFINSYCQNGACDFLNTSNEAVDATEVYDLVVEGAKIQGYEYLGYIIKLVDNAKNYKKETSTVSSVSGDTIEYNIDQTNNIIKTNLIHPKATGNSSNLIRLEIALSDPDGYGAYLVDENNQKIEDLNNVPNKFYIVIPLKDDVSSMNLSHITLRIKGYFVQSKAYDYYANTVVRSGELSHVLFGTIPTEETYKDYSLKNFVKINTLDPKNSLLSGATMVLTKKGDSSYKETWVSDENARFLQLENGEYTLCETKAPKGYAACTECVEFKVDGENVTVLDVKNEEKIEIPNTAKFQGAFIKIFGSVLILIGLGIVGFYFFENENKA